MTSSSVTAPYLIGVDYRPPEPPEVEAEESVEEEVVDGLSRDDFPAWYQDRLDAPEGDTDEPAEPAPPEPAEPELSYAHRLAAVQTVDQLEFGAVTVLAGDNGSGKSTLIEAIAIAAGFNPEGGSRNLKFATYATHSDLADSLWLQWNDRPKWGWFLRAETFYGMASHIAQDDDPEYGVAAIFPDLHNRSHGESFLALARSRFNGPGLYIFDEPESALSIQGQMALAAIMAKSIAGGAQFIVSTHSPVFMAYPGACLHELTADGIARTSFDDLTSTALWRRFFTDPHNFWQTLAEPGE